MVLRVGIDPGVSGGVAAMLDEKLLWARDMPVTLYKSGKSTKKKVSPSVLADWFTRELPRLPDHAIVELVGAMPGQGVTSMFNFGQSYGVILGVLGALYIPVTPVRPQAWRKAAGVHGDKKHSRSRAAELFPANAADFARVKDDGRAEAALIAYSGPRLALPP